MGLLSIFQRNKQASAQSRASEKPGRGGRSAARQAPLANAQNPADTAEAVREARARARTRLMGATVLLLVGVIGFPLLFETQPRPIPVDLPIEIPARNAPGVADAGSHAHAPAPRLASAPALVASGPAPESVSYDARPSAPAAAPAPASAPTPRRSAFAALAAAFTSGPAGNAGTSAPAAAAVASPGATPAKPTVKPEKRSEALADNAAAPAAASRPAPVAHVVLPPPAATPSPAAILAGAPAAKPSEPAAGGRFVVQVGAFLDDAKVREARGKVEKLGMKTYTQPVDTPTGKRVRVRVGPFATKAEADRSASRLKGDGLQAVVLSL